MLKVDGDFNYQTRLDSGDAKKITKKAKKLSKKKPEICEHTLVSCKVWSPKDTNPTIHKKCLSCNEYFIKGESING